MPRTSLLFLSFSLLFSIGAGACGDDGGPNISLTDSGPVDATPAPDAPDAFACTQCDNACVDTRTDPLNCGGCGLACTSAGQICSGTLPCECPADFVPESAGPSGADQVFAQSGAIAAITPVTFGPLNVLAVVYELTLEIDTDYDLATSLANVTPPSAALAYDVDLSAQTARTAYGATEGTIRFNTICSGGVSGTITSPAFAEVAITSITNLSDLAPVPDGCTLSYDTIAFDIGTCPAP